MNRRAGDFPRGRRRPPARTLIQEATHEFAGTADFHGKGCTDDEDGTFRASGLAHAEALGNEERHARLVMMAFLSP